MRSFFLIIQPQKGLCTRGRKLAEIKFLEIYQEYDEHVPVSIDALIQKPRSDFKFSAALKRVTTVIQL